MNPGGRRESWDCTNEACRDMCDDLDADFVELGHLRSQLLAVSRERDEARVILREYAGGNLGHIGYADEDVCACTRCRARRALAPRGTEPGPIDKLFGKWPGDETDEEIEAMLESDRPSRGALPSTPRVPDPAGEPMYPCDDCGKLRTKAEGGTTFTVCDTCWDKHYPPKRRVPERPAAEIAEEVWSKACFSSNPNAMIDAITEAVEADRQGRRGTP